MRLLPKQEIQTLRGTERKQLIDEGAKLAKKVDTLRETASKEEANLAKFRTETLKTVKEELEILILKKIALAREIHDMTVEKDRLRELISNFKNL